MLRILSAMFGESLSILSAASRIISRESSIGSILVVSSTLGATSSSNSLSSSHDSTSMLISNFLGDVFIFGSLSSLVAALIFLRTLVSTSSGFEKVGSGGHIVAILTDCLLVDCFTALATFGSET